MKIDSDKTLTEIIQEAYEQGVKDGFIKGRRESAKEIQPDISFHEPMSMSYLPRYIDIRLDQKMAFCFEQDSKTFGHAATIYSFRESETKEFGFYTSFGLKNGEIADYIHNIVKKSLWKDYTTNYNGFMTFEEYNNKLF